MAGDHYSCAIFCFDILLSGQPKTPPSGDDLAVLDYQIKEPARKQLPLVQLSLRQTIDKLKSGIAQKPSSSSVTPSVERVQSGITQQPNSSCHLHQ